MAAKSVKALVLLLLVASVSARRKREGSQVCTIAREKIKLSAGEEASSSITCSMYSCVGNGTGVSLKIKSCLMPPLQPGCRYSEKNQGLPFPDCCPRVICDPSYKEEDVPDHHGPKGSTGDPADDHLDDTSPLVESYELSQTGLDECVDSSGKVHIQPGQSYEDTQRCLFYTCYRQGSDLAVKVASCRQNKPGPGCHRSPVNATNLFPHCCPKIVCKQKPKKPREPIADKLYQHSSPAAGSHKCYVWNQHLILEEGQQVAIKGGCGLYRCLKNGKLQTTGCTRQPLPPGCRYSGVALDKPFPRCCPAPVCPDNNALNKAPERAEQCLVPGERVFLAVGQTVQSSSSCALFSCVGCGKLQVARCARRQPPPGCRLLRGAVGQPFPSCCPVVACKGQDLGGLQNRLLPYIYGQQNSVYQEADISIGSRGSSTVNTEVLQHSHITGLGPNVCLSPEDQLRIPVGTVVSAKGKCAQYSCGRKGNTLELKYYSCSRKPVPPGCHLVDGDPNSPFPYCCPVTRCERNQVVRSLPTRCDYPEGKITLEEGEAVTDNSQCAQYSCVRVGDTLQLRQKSCDMTSNLPAECHYTEADKTQPFPGCCPTVECYYLVDGRRQAYRLLGQPDHYHRQRRQVNATAEAPGKCYVWKENTKLSVGEQFRAKAQCVLYSCEADGEKTVLKTFGCTTSPLDPGCEYSAQDLTRPFPSCCPTVTCHRNTTQIIAVPSQAVSSGKCYHVEENLQVPLGQVLYGRGKCERYSCLPQGAMYKLKIDRCTVPNATHCTVKPGDMTKRFPNCCPVKECVQVS